MVGASRHAGVPGYWDVQAREPHDSLTRGRVAFRLRSVMTIIPDKSPVARRRDGASAALRGVGLRLTGPRRLVLEVVRGSDAHPTAEAVHQMVRCRLPRVSLGPV